MNYSQFLKNILIQEFNTYKKLKLVEKQKDTKRIYIFNQENTENQYLIELYRFFVIYYKYPTLFSEVILIWKSIDNQEITDNNYKNLNYKLYLTDYYGIPEIINPKTNNYIFVDSDYLAEELYPDFFHFWIAALVTHYRHNYTNYDNDWYYRQEKGIIYNHDNLRIKYNNRVKIKILEDIFNNENLPVHYKYYLIKSGNKLLNNDKKVKNKINELLGKLNVKEL